MRYSILALLVLALTQVEVKATPEGCQKLSDTLDSLENFVKMSSSQAEDLGKEYVDGINKYFQCIQIDIFKTIQCMRTEAKEMKGLIDDTKDLFTMFKEGIDQTIPALKEEAKECFKS